MPKPRAAALYALAATTLSGCGGDGPAVAKLQPSFDVTSAETGEPVAGARVAIGGATYTSDSRGRIFLDVLPEAAATVELLAPAFLERRTTYGRRGTAERFTLWPRVNAVGLDEAFTRELVYTSSSLGVVDPPLGAEAMRRWAPEVTRVEVVLLGPDDDPRYLPFTATSLERHRQAVAELNTSTGGRLVYADPREGADVATVGTVRVRVFPEYSSCVSSPTTAGITTTDGPNLRAPVITYCRPEQGLGLIVHELGHTFGLRHSSASTDIMYRSSIRVSAFSPRERTTLAVMLHRSAGNRYPDTDPAGLAAASLSSRPVDEYCE